MLGFDWVFLEKIWVLLGFWRGQSGFLTNLGSGNPGEISYFEIGLV